MPQAEGAPLIFHLQDDFQDEFDPDETVLGPNRPVMPKRPSPIRRQRITIPHDSGDVGWLAIGVVCAVLVVIILCSGKLCGA